MAESSERYYIRDSRSTRELGIASFIEDRIAVLARASIDKPELQAFITADSVAQGRVAFQQALGVPSIDTRVAATIMRDTYAMNPDGIYMAISDDATWMLGSNEAGVFAMAPVLTCTQAALVDAYQDSGAAIDGFRIVHSMDGLAREVWQRLQQNPRDIMSYEHRMNPSDYLAIAIQGGFSNEVLRKRLKLKPSAF